MQAYHTRGDVMKAETLIELTLAIACWGFVGGLVALVFV